MAINTVKVYGIGFSTATAMVCCCLHEKQVQFELVPVDLRKGEHKHPSFLALNPFGVVPAFQDGDFTLFESRAIAKYVSSKFEGQGTDLLGSSLCEKAVVDQWCCVEALSFNAPASALAFQLLVLPAMGGESDEAIVQSNLEKLNKVLDIYEERLSKSKYLGGEFFSLADLQHLPNINYLVNAAGKGEIVSSRKHVNAWWKDISSRPAWQKVAETMKA